MTTIKTLAEILADMGEPISANLPTCKTDKPKPTTDHDLPQWARQPTTDRPPSQHKKQPEKLPQKLPKPQSQSGQINILLDDNTQQILDESTRHALQNVSIEPIYQNNKAVNRLRWLAFYYLSNRELSQAQLRQKLLDKDYNPDMVAELLTEFADKGYQSDERCAYMLIREGVRRGRGKRHIAQSLKKAGLTLPYSLDELITQAGVASVSDGTILEQPSDDEQAQINWLKLAVEARCKKYGNHLPKDQKEKARQLRFLQYRGFEMGVCFDALKHTLDDL